MKLNKKTVFIFFSRQPNREREREREKGKYGNIYQGMTLEEWVRGRWDKDWNPVKSER